MARTKRKRKSSEKIGRKITSKKKKVNSPKCTADESEKENLAEINNDIKIIRLTENLLENDEEEDDDEDNDWEDVSDLDDRSDIIVNLNEESFGMSSAKNDEKREQQKQAREKRELIHKTHLLSLIGRVIFINKSIGEELLQNLSLSCLADCNIASKKWREPHLNRVVSTVASRFVLEEDESESGKVVEILKSSLETHRVTRAWINVLLVSIVRSIGIRARLVAILYPTSLRADSKPAPQPVLCPPTAHKPSSRGGDATKKRKIFSSKSIVSPENQRSSSIEFSLELLDVVTHEWVPFDPRVPSSWRDLSVVLGERRRFVYCLAIDNGGRIKNLAAKYDRAWATSASRRLRVADSVLVSMIGSMAVAEDSPEERLENATVRDRLIEQGVPVTRADLKGHPVFVARSHLLKYEVLHPDDEAAPCGRWQREDVFLRDRVQLAHTRETWLKEAKVIRSGELPIKKVKTMSSRRRNTEQGADPFVELFGPWQVEPYVAPVASGGLVPRNRFDNVDMFQPSMLPVGCSYLRYPELNKVAAKLGIDCAPAMVGWAFTKQNRARPVHDGWVVCNEYVDVLRSAVLECRRDRQARLAEQRERLVVKRWEVLTRRLLLKDRLRLQYNF